MLLCQFHAKISTFLVKKCSVRLLALMLTLKCLAENDVKNWHQYIKKTSWRHPRDESRLTPRVRRHFLAPVSVTEIPVEYARIWKSLMALKCTTVTDQHHQACHEKPNSSTEWQKFSIHTKQPLLILLIGPGHVSAICKQQRCRSACASAQSDQHLCCSLLRYYDMYTCYIQSFNILASFCSWAGWFECYLVENPRRHIFVWCGSIVFIAYPSLDNYTNHYWINFHRNTALSSFNVTFEWLYDFLSNKMYFTIWDIVYMSWKLEHDWLTKSVDFIPSFPFTLLFKSHKFNAWPYMTELQIMGTGIPYIYYKLSGF